MKIDEINKYTLDIRAFNKTSTWMSNVISFSNVNGYAEACVPHDINTIVSMSKAAVKARCLGILKECVEALKKDIENE